MDCYDEATGVGRKGRVMLIQGKRCVVTGASSGIGRALTELLLNEGAMVVGIDQTIPPDLPTHPRYTPLVADLSHRDQVQSSYKQAYLILGEVDVYVANAGQARYSKDDELSEADTALLWDINVNAVIEACRLLRAAHHNRPFSMVVVSSATAHLPLPGYAIYRATKSAVASYIQSIPFELTEGQIAHLVYPAATSTNFFAVSGQPHRSWFVQTPQQVAQRIVKGLQSSRLDIYPSRIFRFFNAVLPFALRIYTMRESILFRKYR